MDDDCNEKLKRYFYIDNFSGKALGPHTIKELTELEFTNNISSDSQVAEQGTENWLPFSEVLQSESLLLSEDKSKLMEGLEKKKEAQLNKELIYFLGFMVGIGLTFISFFYHPFLGFFTLAVTSVFFINTVVVSRSNWSSSGGGGCSGGCSGGGSSGGGCGGCGGCGGGE